MVFKVIWRDQQFYLSGLLPPTQPTTPKYEKWKIKHKNCAAELRSNYRFSEILCIWLIYPNRFPNIPNSLYLVSSFGETGYQYNAQALDTLKGPFLTRTGHETKCYILQCTKFSEPYMGTQLVWCCCKKLYKPKNWHT